MLTGTEGQGLPTIQPVTLPKPAPFSSSRPPFPSRSSGHPSHHLSASRIVPKVLQRAEPPAAPRHAAQPSSSRPQEKRRWLHWPWDTRPGGQRAHVLTRTDSPSSGGPAGAQTSAGRLKPSVLWPDMAWLGLFPIFYFSCTPATLSCPRHPLPPRVLSPDVTRVCSLDTALLGPLKPPCPCAQRPLEGPPDALRQRSQCISCARLPPPASQGRVGPS